MKLIIISDSYKGSLSSGEAGKIIADAFVSAASELKIPTPKILRHIMADGGEGTCEALGAKKVYAKVTGPDGEPVDAFFGLCDDGSAVIEMAACAALTQTKLRNPLLTTTYGVGELIRLAIEAGKRNIVLTLGGSATNDGGCGMAAALGVKFFDSHGKSFVPVGGTLCDIAKIDGSECKALTDGITFTAMCDVTNPLYGQSGAAFVFAPQKGADQASVKALDAGLMRFSETVKQSLGVDVSMLSGSGAAGGMGGGVVAFLGGTLKSGAEVILDSIDFDGELSDADLAISGEGRFDSQSGGGKVVSAVAKRCEKHGVPLLVFAGSCQSGAGGRDCPVTASICIQRGAVTLDEAMKNAGEYLYDTAYNTARLIFAGIGSKRS